MSTPEYRRSERLMNSLVRAGKLTETGKAYCFQTTDPYHDKDIAPTGMPDAYMARSVCEKVKQKITIKKNANLPAGNWDCNVFSLPWVDEQTIHRYQMRKNVLTGGSGAGEVAYGPVGGIIACQMATGQPTSISKSSTPGSENWFDCLMVDREFLDGPCRVVSAGFEVTNTTSELYKQGDVSVYRVPEPQRERVTMSISSNAAAPYTTHAVTFSAELHSKFPTTVGEAEYMVGTRTWEAADGCYIPLTLAGLENPVRGSDSSCVVLRTGAESGSFTPSALTGSTDPQFSPTIPYPRACVTTPFNMGGAYFTGLSEQTTLTITAIWYIERFPTTLQKQLSVLAKPPPLYDPIAFEIYNAMMREMPVGVMVKENGLGDWFAEVVGNVAPMIEGILGAIPHPYAQGGAQIAKFAGKVADRYRVPPGEKGDGVAQALKQQRKAAKKAGKGMVKRAKARTEAEKAKAKSQRQ